MKKLVCALIAISFALTMSGGFTYAQAQAQTQSGVSLILCDCDTGQVLSQTNADQKRPIASVTKIMTLLIAAQELEAGRLRFDDEIVASHHASTIGGSVIWLEENERMSAYDIIRSVVISSANDACVALAEHISGSEEEFVKRMNASAKELMMTSTNFTNCTGLDDENHYSTAADVAKMAAQLRKYSYFDEFFLTRLTYVREGTERETQLLNTNKLITSYEGITGLKTGTTDNAGYCFTGTAKRSGTELVAVVLGASSDEERFDLATELLDSGFDGFELFVPEFDDEKLAPVPVVQGTQKTVGISPDETLRCLIPRGSSDKISYLYDIPKSLTAPVEEGGRAGKIVVLLGNDTLFVCPVTAKNAVGELTYGYCAGEIFKEIFRM